LAVITGNPVIGAAILFIFTLGTSPTFFLLGYLTTKLGDVLQSAFTKTVAIGILFYAVSNLNNALALTGSTVTVGSLISTVNCAISFCKENVPIQNVVAIIDGTTITITDAGYFPNSLSVKRGTKVRLELVNNDAIGCAQSFTTPQLGLQKVVPMGSHDAISCTAPKEPGEVKFMCGMGMHSGTIRVI
jgi:heme/copper-type cytochrome/quinol oxidase subunit 2